MTAHTARGILKEREYRWIKDAYPTGGSKAFLKFIIDIRSIYNFDVEGCEEKNGNFTSHLV